MGLRRLGLAANDANSANVGALGGMHDRDLTNVQFPMLNSYPNRSTSAENCALGIEHSSALPNESPDPKFATVGAVYDCPYFVESRKNGRS
ncbi:MAG: hypothetical protein DMG13_01955 [Acidobacteria bacterium]|nr:MAG: hypothetical protein DMG13_01955 [Acidobacteriota bacterium]